MKVKTTATSAKSLPREIIEILGPPPILYTEDKIYYSVLACFRDNLNPTDIISWMLIKDLADYRVEIARYRNIKTALLQNESNRIISDALDRESRQHEDARQLISAKYAREVQAVEDEFADKPDELEHRKAQLNDKQIAELEAADEEWERDQAIWGTFRRRGDMFPRALNSCIDKVEAVDRLVEIAEERFYKALRAIEHYLGGFSETLRKRCEKIIDGEVIERRDDDGSDRASRAA